MYTELQWCYVQVFLSLQQFDLWFFILQWGKSDKYHIQILTIDFVSMFYVQCLGFSTMLHWKNREKSICSVFFQFCFFIDMFSIRSWWVLKLEKDDNYFTIRKVPATWKALHEDKLFSFYNPNGSEMQPSFMEQLCHSWRRKGEEDVFYQCLTSGCRNLLHIYKHIAQRQLLPPVYGDFTCICSSMHKTSDFYILMKANKPGIKAHKLWNLLGRT